MSLLFVAAAHAGCAGGTCPPPTTQESLVPVEATAPRPPIDVGRPDEIRTVVFALG